MLPIVLFRLVGDFQSLFMQFVPLFSKVNDHMIAQVNFSTFNSVWTHYNLHDDDDVQSVVGLSLQVHFSTKAGVQVYKVQSWTVNIYISYLLLCFYPNGVKKLPIAGKRIYSKCDTLDRLFGFW